MNLVAPSPYDQVANAALVAVPTQWIESGAVTPVVASPAAQAPTMYVAPPSAMQATQPTLLDAITGAILGMPYAAPEPVVVIPAPAPVHAPVPVPVSAPPVGATAEVALAGYAAATGEVDGAGSAKPKRSAAKRVGTELWAGIKNPRAIHVSQVPSKYNKTPAAANKDCGPVSVVMALKLLGKAIPGTTFKMAPQQLVNRVRQLSGNFANTAPTTNHELERALSASGAATREIADAGSIRASVLSGKPVILNGNPGNAGAYGAKFTAAQMAKYNGGHWIVVSGLDSKSGLYIINDPLSKVGPVKVTPAQLEAYRGGSLGIEVAA